MRSTRYNKGFIPCLAGLQVFVENNVRVYHILGGKRINGVNEIINVSGMI